MGGWVQAQTGMAQSSFYSVNDRRLHFGLGTSTQVDFELHWTNGLIDAIHGVPANRLITVKEAHGVIKAEGMTGFWQARNGDGMQRTQTEV